jgi:hypothetical protein
VPDRVTDPLRWWTCTELEATDEEIWPADLLNIIRQST